MRSGIELAKGIRMPTHYSDGLVTMAANGVKKWKRVEKMVTVAVQTDVSTVVCGEVVVEQRGALPEKQR